MSGTRAPAGLTRAFLAVYPDPPTLDRLRDLLARLAPEQTGIRWTRDDQLHFTLRFFGDRSDDELARIRAVMDEIAPARPRFAFPLNGLGAFPDLKRPRVVWVGAGAGGEDLEDLARVLEHGFRRSGLGESDKPFRAHLTIGRVREGGRLEPAALEALRREPFATPPMAVGELRLMASRLGPGGATHTLLHATRLGISAP